MSTRVRAGLEHPALSILLSVARTQICVYLSHKEYEMLVTDHYCVHKAQWLDITLVGYDTASQCQISRKLDDPVQMCAAALRYFYLHVQCCLRL